MRVRLVAFTMLTSAIVVAMVAPVAAQELHEPGSSTNPRIEISGGYLLTHDQSAGFNLPTGFVAGANSTGRIGVAGEVGASYGRPFQSDLSVPFRSSISEWSFTAGPRLLLSARPGVRPFAQVLAGVSRFRSDDIVLMGSSGNLFTDETVLLAAARRVSGFCLAPGGGVDLRLPNPRLALRARAAVSFTRFSGDWSTGISFGVGIAFGAGN